MIETLLKRRTIREFLKSYSEEQWKDLIPAVFEIGVLSLEKSFNKILFTKDELKDIIEDLINSDYHRSKQPKKIEKLQNPNQPQTQPPIAKPVPSTDKQQPTSKNQLYPLWWGNEQQQEIQNQIAYQEQLNSDQVRTNYQYNNPKTFEVNNNLYQQRPFTAGKPPQQQQQQTQLNRKYRSNEYIPQNEMYTESEESYSNNQRYDINRSNSGKLVMNKLTKENNMNSYIPKNKVNYKISYDKDLRPQSIEKKSKEQKRSSINNTNTNTNNEFRTTSSKDKMQTSNSFRKDDMKDSDSRYDMNKRNKEECYYMDYPGENVENVQEEQQQQLHVVQKEGIRNYSHKPSKQVSRQSSQKHSMLQQSPSDNNDTQELQHNNNNNDENLFVESGGEQIDKNNNQQQIQYEQIVNENKGMMDSNYSNGDGNINNNNEINVYQEQQQNVQYKYKNPQNVPTTQIKNEGVNNNSNSNTPQIQQNDVNENMNIEINNTNKYTQQKQLSANKQSEMNNNNNNNWNNQQPSSHIQIQQRHTQITNNNNNNNTYQQQNPNRNKYNNIQQYEYHHNQQMNMNNNNYNLPNEYNHIHHYDNNRIYNLQTSNYSNNQYNPTEQLSMIEVSDELKSKKQITFINTYIRI